MSKSYLLTFFKEKQLPIAMWQLDDKHGETHFIDNQVVIEAVLNTNKNEQKGIADMIRKIDFNNGDVNNYLKHLAGALINA